MANFTHTVRIEESGAMRYCILDRYGRETAKWETIPAGQLTVTQLVAKGYKPDRFGRYVKPA